MAWGTWMERLSRLGWDTAQNGQPEAACHDPWSLPNIELDLALVPHLRNTHYVTAQTFSVLSAPGLPFDRT